MYARHKGTPGYPNRSAEVSALAEMTAAFTAGKGVIRPDPLADYAGFSVG
jgi:hypothetical protein